MIDYAIVIPVLSVLVYEKSGKYICIISHIIVCVHETSFWVDSLGFIFAILYICGSIIICSCIYIIEIQVEEE